MSLIDRSLSDRSGTGPGFHLAGRFRNPGFPVIALVLTMSAVAPTAADDDLPPPLAPCPSSPNCVCSEYSDSGAHILPLAADEPDAAWQAVAAAVEAIGGVIVERRDGYLRAEFTSRLFRFVDDLELRLDQASRQIHVRSASRVGYYDFGVNRRRVGALREAYLSRQH